MNQEMDVGRAVGSERGRRSAFSRCVATGVLVVMALVGAGLDVDGAAPAAAATSFDFSGGGFGHGVGMSQWGAKGRADAGQTAPQILAAYYAGTAIESTFPGAVRVKLADAASTTVGQAAGNVSVTPDGAGSPSVTAGPGATIGLRAVGDTLVANNVTPTPGPDVTVTTGGGAAAVAFTQGTPMSVGATGRRYQWGRLVLRASAGRLELVLDQLSMQQYLWGLGEVPGSWPAEALGAQAIAARSYAAYRLAHPASSRFDLSASLDEAYVGADIELGSGGPNWVAAVNATDGQVLTYGGAAIQAFYAASDGGSTEASEYVFVAALPYLRPVDDPWDRAIGNPNFSWHRQYTGTELGSWLTAAGRGDVGEVQGIDLVSGAGASGRLDKAQVRVRGSSGTITLTGAQLRSAINASASSSRDLLSTKFSFAGGVAPSAPPGGKLDLALGWGNAALVLGWAVDPDTPAQPVTVRLYVNGAFATAVAADRSRDDIGRLLPWFGPRHAFAGLVTAPGASTVCAYATDTSSQDPSLLLGCAAVLRPKPVITKPAARKRARAKVRVARKR